MALPTQLQTLNQTVRALDSLPTEIRTLTAQNEQLYRFRDSLAGQVEQTQQGLTRFEGQFQDYQQEIRTTFSQLRAEIHEQVRQVGQEIPDPAQVSALIDQLAGLQGEFIKWQRNYTQELDQLKQTVLQLQVAPKAPTVVAPPEPVGVFEDYFNAGKILLLSGDSRQAIQNFNLALRVNGQSAEAWYALAIAQAQEYLVDPALNSLEQAVQLNPAKRNQAATGQDFPALLGNERFNRLVGQTPARNQQEEDILLPQVDLANLFDL